MERYLPILAAIVLGLTLYVNYLAGTGYLNNISTGEVSALYPSLFTPAGVTFAIWGLIYGLNLIFMGYQLFKMVREPEKLDVGLNGLFILVCLTNAVWMFTWHLQKIGWAWLLMLVILVLLIACYRRVRGAIPGSAHYFLEYINFSVYLAWICVATVANTAIFLITLGMPAYGVTAAVLTSVVILVVAALAIWLVLRDGNVLFGLVIIWAAYGIIVARSTEAFPFAPTVAMVALVAMILVFAALVFRIYVKRKHLKQLKS